MARSVNRAFVVLQPPVTEGGVRTELSASAVGDETPLLFRTPPEMSRIRANPVNGGQQGPPRRAVPGAILFPEGLRETLPSAAEIPVRMS